MKQLFVLGCILILSVEKSVIHAQIHHNIWFRSTIRVPINSRVTWDTELQHRRQNSWNNQNLFSENLMYTCRFWVHYKQHETLTWSVSPFAWFSNYPIIQHQGDEFGKPRQEIRLATTVEFHPRLMRNLSVIGRQGVEYRIFIKASEVFRHRTRIGFQYEITRKIHSQLFNELFINFYPRHKGPGLDHNRTALMLEYMLGTRGKMDIGYMRAVRFQSGSSNFIGENNWIFNLTMNIHRSKLQH